MDKFDKHILVVPRAILLPDNKHFEGFVAHNTCDFEQIMLTKHLFMRRGDAEVDPTHLQPIPYCLVVNPQTKKVFAFQRAHNIKHLREERLHGKWSWGVGGHVDRPENHQENPIHESMLRELDEEIEILGTKKLQVLGYINSEATEVDKVHFGVLYMLETDATEIQIKASEVASGKMMSLEELQVVLQSKDCEVEEWSKIAYHAVKEYFNNN